MSAVFVSNLIINTGATFSQSFDLLNSDSSGPLNLDGFTVASQFRKHAGSSTKTDFTTEITDSSNGQISISLSSTQTAAISKPGRYVYDVVINSGTVKTRVIEGSVLVREGVTK
tara:strand:+ start:120 stop:461 length:342 start_codon:yes stop_codon:yes gene_type:complete